MFKELFDYGKNTRTLFGAIEERITLSLCTECAANESVSEDEIFETYYPLFQGLATCRCRLEKYIELSFDKSFSGQLEAFGMMEELTNDIDKLAVLVNNKIASVANPNVEKCL